MNFEKGPVAIVNNQERKHSLYRERESFSVPESVQQLKDILDGKIERKILSESEKEEVYEFESELIEKMRSVNEGPSFKFFYSDYFLTEEGREDFKKEVGVEVDAQNHEEFEEFVYRNRKSIDESKGVSKMTLRSRAFYSNKMAASIASSADQEGNVDFSDLEVPHRVEMVNDLENAIDMVKRLREFKADLKETYESFGDSNVENAKKKVLDIYAKSVNQTLAEHFRTEVFFDKIKEIDSDFYDDNKEVVKKLFIGTSKKERRYSAYDKFIFGASREYDEDGMRRQIGKELEKYGDEIADAYVENEIRKIEGCREKGLDLKKIEKESVKSETFAGWFEDLLEKQGQLSEDQYSEQDAKRKGAAPDDKWQIDVSSEYGAADVDGKKKLIKLNSSDKSIYKVVATYLGHEWTHVIQNINREKVGLQIFREKMSDRQDVLAEGGAMMIENKISQEAFGFGRVPIPHYLRAMKRKLDGGNYIDCVEAYYNSSLEILRKKKELGLIDEAKFKSSIKAIAKNAVAGPRRLFSNGADLSISGKELPRSRDAVYLEQVRVMEELKKENLENLSLIMGVNLENLVSLAEAGLVDLGDIQEPELYALEIWDEIADDYKSEEAV